ATEGYPVASCIEKVLVEPRKRFTITDRLPTVVVGGHQMGNPGHLAIPRIVLYMDARRFRTGFRA
ncbi:MAG: hypothetical protein WBD63_04290, partial [Phycisphaerae bacterium]